jgi:acetyltransferase-like isoleucine patch superfamily enzyme
MNLAKLKKLAALGISVLPAPWLRLGCYRLMPGYTIGRGTRLAWGVWIAVDRFVAGEDVVVGRGTSFVGPITVRLESKAFVGRFNKIFCGEHAASAEVSKMGYAREFIAGENSLIHEGHLFDVYGRIRIGKGSWVAGFGSQFLTHGASAMNRDIEIGEGCYLGSAVRFAPGSGVGDRVLVGMGAVVTKQLSDSDVVVGGVPAKVIKSRTADDGYLFTRNW